MSADPDDNLLARIERLCGPETVQKLCAAFGGTQVYVPRDVQAGQQLSAVIGAPAATKISREIAVGHVMIPLGHASRQSRIVAEVLRLSTVERMSHSRIARETGLHQRTVQRIISSHKRKPS